MRPICVIANSARRLAQAAADADFTVAAIDSFNDRDLNAVTGIWRQLPTNLSTPQAYTQLVQALDSVAQELVASPYLLIGAPFENYPHVVDALATRFNVLANTCDAVRKVRDPWHLQHLVASAGLAALPVSAVSATLGSGSDYLLKRVDAAGGSHVAEGQARIYAAQREVFQTRADGRSLSATFLSDATRCHFIGACEHHFVQNNAQLAWRQSGLIGPIEIQPAVADMLARLGSVVHQHTGLRGCWGIDFILDPDQRIRVVECNPRFPSSFELLASAADVLRAHVDAFCGASDKRVTINREVRGSLIVYAQTDSVVPKGIDFPAWAADLPRVGTQIAVDDPLCTLYAEGSDSRTVATRLEERLAAFGVAAKISFDDA